MGLFDKLFSSKERQRQLRTESYWKLLNGYTPVFRTWDGQLYESELVRSAIDARSRHISKLRVYMDGAGQPKLKTKLKQRPNDYLTWSQFLYRLNTILDMQNTAFIIPIFDEWGETIGITTVLPVSYELVNANGEPWIRFEFANREHAAIEISKVGILTKYQYASDLFGSDTKALNDTMALLTIQKQGIEEAVKNSSTYRFWAQANNLIKVDDLAKERKRFSEQNFGEDAGGGGLLLFPGAYQQIHQVDHKPYTADSDTVDLIQKNVFNYYGVNDKILQNRAEPAEMDAFYNGCIEPFAIQLSEVLSLMIYTKDEISHGSWVVVDSNRLQYMTTAQKISLVQQLGDRGMITINEARELFNYKPIEGGDVSPIRGEFKPISDLGDDATTQTDITYIPKEITDEGGKEDAS